MFKATGLAQDDSSAFAQLTVRLASEQCFAAFDRRGRLVAGSEVTGAQSYDRAACCQVLHGDVGP